MDADRFRRGSELLERIYSDPSDDGARAVYADFLASDAEEEERERGALITLQLAKTTRKLAKDEKALEAKLLKSNKMVWLGPLVDLLVARGLKYARGFPEHGAFPEVAKPEVIARLTGHRRWRTFRTLDLRGGGERFASLLAHDALHSLEELVNVRANGLTGFVDEAPRALSRLLIENSIHQLPPGFLDGKGVPRLHTFGFSSPWGENVSELAPFVSSTLGKQVTRFEVAHSAEAMPQYRRWAPALMKTHYASFRVSALRSWQRGASFTFDGTRDGDRWKMKTAYVTTREDRDRFKHLADFAKRTRKDLKSLELRVPSFYTPAPSALTALKNALGDVPFKFKK